MALLKSNLIPDWIIKIILFGSAQAEQPLRLFKKAIKHAQTEVLSQRLKLIRAIKSPTVKIDIPAIYIKPSKDWLVSGNTYKNVSVQPLTISAQIYVI